MDKLQSQIEPLQRDINQLNRQFWVSKEQVRERNYDLSASRYRHPEQDDLLFESPSVILERLEKAEILLVEGVSDIKTLLK